MKALEKVRAAGEFLRNAGIDNSLRDAELIVAHCLGISRVNLFREDPAIGEDAVTLIEKSLRRRAQGEPLQYILGYTEFLGLIIRVGPGALIPRPETELLVEEAIKILKTQTSRAPLSPFSKGGGRRITEINSFVSPLRMLDLCTGSGCIALALAREFPDAHVYGTDTSETAIRYAEENARMNVIQNAAFLRGPLFKPIQRNLGNGRAKASFDLIISNPPYIRTDDIKTLQPEIKDWEPADALDGGEDGLSFYRTIIPEARRYLKREGSLMFEIGIDQAEAVRGIARTSGYKHNAVRKDYAGIDRIITIWR